MSSFNQNNLFTKDSTMFQSYYRIGDSSRPSAFTPVKRASTSSLNTHQLSIDDMGQYFKIVQKQNYVLNPFGPNGFENNQEKKKRVEDIRQMETPKFKADFQIELPEVAHLNAMDVDTYSSDDKNVPNSYNTDHFRQTVANEFLDNLEGPSTKFRKLKASAHDLESLDLASNNKSTIDDELRMNSSETTRNEEFCRFSIGNSAKKNDSDNCVGKYTQKERNEKIKKYKEKIQKWLKGEHKNKNRYIKRRNIAKNKPRVGGKFIKKCL